MKFMVEIEGGEFVLYFVPASAFSDKILLARTVSHKAVMDILYAVRAVTGNL